MIETDHPNYPEPTLLEALAEIHFQLPAGFPWANQLMGEFYKRIQSDYPDIEPIIDMGVQMDFGATHGVPFAFPARQRFRYKHKSRSLMLQLAEGVFTVNTLRPYQGWLVMRQDIVDAWVQLAEVVHPAAVVRISLRYINKIPLFASDPTPGYWLKANDFIAANVLQSQPGFLSRSEVRAKPQNSTVVTLAYQPPVPGHNQGSAGFLIFDIDRIEEAQVSIESSALLLHLDALHKDVWMVFQSAAKHNLESLLKGTNPCP